VVITDSGGLQEETTALGVPCLTLRDNTERPITVTEGTNEFVLDLFLLVEKVLGSRRGNHATRPNGWDGMQASS
jgi:UDP-N-acetylglucosamine 2-epimerase (non-hydrolysing)